MSQPKNAWRSQAFADGVRFLVLKFIVPTCSVIWIVIFSLSFFLLGILPIFGAIVSGIWLATLGEWRLILTGITLGLLMPLAYSVIAVLPVYMLLKSNPFLGNTAGNDWKSSVVAYAAMLWQNTIIGIWVLTVFLLFRETAETSATMPVLLWAYSTAMIPVAYMANNERNTPSESASGFSCILAASTYVFSVVMHLFGLSSTAMVIVVAGLVLVVSVLAANSALSIVR